MLHFLGCNKSLLFRKCNTVRRGWDHYECERLGSRRVASGWARGQFTETRSYPHPLAGAHSLTTATWVTMIVIGAFVWGGFALVLSKAVRTESEKSEAERA